MDNKELFKRYRAGERAFEAVDLRNVDLNGFTLRDAILRRADLSGANLLGARLPGADLIQANLHGADLRHADLSDAVLCSADLSQASMVDADLSRADLRQANLDGTALGGAILHASRLAGLDLTRVRPHTFDRSQARLDSVDLSGADLAEANLSRVRVSKASMRCADLRRAHLAGAVIHWSDLRGANLAGANLEGAELLHSNLSGASLAGVNLKGASLTYLLRRADLRGADLQRADLWGVNLQGADLSRTDLRGADFKRAYLRGAIVDDGTQMDVEWRLVWEILNCGGAGQDLRGANLSAANLTKADLRGANLSGLKLLWLSGADLREANLQGAEISDLRGADLRRADLRGARLVHLQGANLRGADLRGARLRQMHQVVVDQNTRLDAKWQLVWELANQGGAGRDLTSADLSETDLHEVNLVGANLEGADLSNSDLSGANLEGASLKGVHLHKARLSGANLKSVNLKGADLSKAALWSADLSEADLAGADLTEADLGKADLSLANLRGATLDKTRMWRANVHGAVLENVDLRRARKYSSITLICEADRVMSILRALAASTMEPHALSIDPVFEGSQDLVDLAFPVDKKVRLYLNGATSDELLLIDGVERGKISAYVRILRGERFAQVSVTATRPDTNSLFCESYAVHDFFLEILEQGQGLAALIDVEEHYFRLLEDPRIKITISGRRDYPIWGQNSDPQQVDSYIGEILHQVRPVRRTGPVIDAEYSFLLFFPAAKAGNLLQAISKWAVSPFPRRTDLVLADGSTVTVPFRSLQGDNQTISLVPKSKVCLHTLLSFPTGDQEYRGRGDPARAAALLAGGAPLYVRLWVYMGDKHVGLLFYPPNPHTGWFFVESAAIHRVLAQLLESHEGILGVLTDGVDERVYLLPHLDAYLEVVEVSNYLSPEVDIEGLLHLFQEHAPRPIRPPTTDLPRLAADEAVDPDALAKILEHLMGPRRGPIPQRYQRTFEERPFETCDFCDKPLLEAGTCYTVTKIFAEGELRQELAICRDCTAILEKGYSEQSRQATQWLLYDFSPAKRLRAAMREGGDPAEYMTRECLLCGTPRDDAATFVEYAACEADEIVYQIYPLLICETCLLHINDVLSDQTREAWRRFYDDHFGLPTPGAPALAQAYHLIHFG